MQIDINPIEELSQIAPSKESLYRTKWLMAHNRLHKIAHDPSHSLIHEWEGYLSELQTASAIAKTPA